MNIKPGKMDYQNPNQIHLFEKTSKEKELEKINQIEQEERDQIGLKYNIYGDARKRMIKKGNNWELDGQTVEEYSAMMERIEKAEDKDEVKNKPYAN